MHNLFQILAIATLSITVSTNPVDIYKQDSPLKVTLTAVDNAVFKATVTNTGAEDLKLLAYGTVFDSAPVQKLNVFAANSSTASPFTGILRSVKSTGLADEAFVSLPAGATYETTIDSAAVHDISSTGAYTFVAEGSIPYAKANSSDLSGKAVYFKSNALTVHVDGDAAAAVPYTIPTSLKRADVQSGCSSAQNSATTQALANCASLANAASTAATSGSSSKFSEYFKTTSTSTRSIVAARFSAVASECSSATSGVIDYYCTDIYGYCESNVLAYTIPTQSAVINCPLYYSELTALTDTCHEQDQATTTLHELTHAPAVYSPGTDDYGYGYAAATRLSSSVAVLNADSYALYANAIYAGC